MNHAPAPGPVNLLAQWLVGPDGTLYAHATTTCLVFDMPAPRGS